MCSQPPITPEQAYLNALLKQRERLMRIMASGLQEIEQPALGRSQYRSIDDLERALRALDGLIAGLVPGTDTAAARRTRRPIYPVVTEL
jgi:hypothetical protein